MPTLMTGREAKAAVLEFALFPAFPAIGEAHPLRRNYVRRLYLAFLVASACHLAGFAAFLIQIGAQHMPLPGRTIRIVVAPPPTPPSLVPRVETPMGNLDVILPKVGVPEPVPDFTAPDVQLADKGDLARLIDAESASTQEVSPGDSLSFRLPPLGTGGSPAPGAFVAYEEAPALINVPTPVYPEMARSAEMEGVVRLLVLVGKDGRVKDARADEDLPMLREAALAAARQAIYRPALQQHRPTEVWVQMSMRFVLH